MGDQTKHFKTAVSSTLMLSLLALAGCNKPAEAPPQAAAAAPAPAAPYTPPTAEQLSQMVAPIALFPDKLVGQVLAGATYPEQIAAADQWLAQHPSLKGEALQNAENDQPWDVSVKSLTAFPTVLNQMAGNMQWTRALGDAYVNDPNDVMNAIQVLRQRAQQAGNLKTSPQLRVSTTVRAPAPPPEVIRSETEPVVYSGPAVIQPPPQTIIIEPAQPDVVYVPHYNPAVVYGEPVPVYPGWTYRQPAYSSEALVTTGVLSFGVGVLVGAAVSHHHDWGWNAWGVNWGAPHPGYNGGWQRPAVVYNNSTYISKSVTVVNHVNNINVTNNNYRTTNNVVNRTQTIAINNAPARPAQQMGGPMTMPHFTARDTVPGSRPAPVAMDMHARTTPPTIQHEQRQPPRLAQEMPPMANKSPRAEPFSEHASVPATLEHPHADAMRAHADADREHTLPPQEHSVAAMHPPPIQHAEATVPHAPPPNRDLGVAERMPPHAPHQDMLAMHTAKPPAAKPAPAPAKPHVEKHEENNHHHDKHDAQEHHS